MPITNEVNNARRFCKGAYRIGERTVTFLVAVILPTQDRLAHHAVVPPAGITESHRGLGQCPTLRVKKGIAATHAQHGVGLIASGAAAG